MFREGVVLALLIVWWHVDAVAPGVEIYNHGDNNYPCIRTPSLLRVGNTDRMLAFAGTRCGKGDGCYPTDHFKPLDHQDTVLRISNDSGVTWSPLRALFRGPCADHDHGASVYDTVRDAVVLVITDAQLQTSFMKSADGGETWTTPRKIDLGQYNTTRVSPGRGLQLKASNPHAPNRLVFVAQIASNAGNVIYYTDDGGETWTLSPTVVPQCNEAQIVELENGTLLLNARDTSINRVFSLSNDGGATWSSGRVVHDIQGTRCMGSFLSGTTSGGKTVLLYSHPASDTTRENGTVWISYDQAASFTPFLQVAGTDVHQQFAYSCLSDMDGSGKFGLLYETGSESCTVDSASCRIMFMTFTVG